VGRLHHKVQGEDRAADAARVVDEVQDKVRAADEVRAVDKVPDEDEEWGAVDELLVPAANASVPIVVKRFHISKVCLVLR